MPFDGAEVVQDERFHVAINPTRTWATVCRLRLARDEVEAVVAEIGGVTKDVEIVTWNVGSSAEPPDLPERLRALGLRDPEPPLDPVCAALVLAEEPPDVAGVEVRRVESLEEFLAGVEIVIASDTWSPEAAARERDRAPESYERRRRRGGLLWLAYLDARPVAFAAAAPSEAGLFLDGGATLPEARGHGCYRALVRARWDEAVRLGLPGLAVQAQLDSSAPILRRLGFEEVATIHTLQ